MILLYPRLRLVCRKGSKATGAFISTDRSNNSETTDWLSLTEMSSYSGLFAGTVFALNKEQQGILNSFLLNGYRWIVWKGYMDVNALDRQLFHSGQIHKAFSLAFATNALMRGSSAEDIRQMNEFLKDNYAPEKKR